MKPQKHRDIKKIKAAWRLSLPYESLRFFGDHVRRDELRHKARKEKQIYKTIEGVQYE